MGQILNSDLASSYFPFNTPTVFVFLPVLHPNRSFEISMTIVLILQQGLSESSRSRVSLLHSAQCNVFVFVFVYLSFFPFCFCLGRRSSLEQNQFQSTISIRYCVDEDDEDSGGRTQRDCLTLAAPGRKVSSSKPSFFAPKIITKIGGCRAKICNGYDPGVVVSA